MLDSHWKANSKSMKVCTLIAVSLFTLNIFDSSSGILAQPDETNSEGAPNQTSLNQLTRAPEVIESVEPELGAGAPKLEVDVVIVLELTVGVDGKVSDVVVKENAHPVLDEAAVNAIKRFTFRPAEVDGQPGAVRIQYRYVFESQAAESTPESDSHADTTAPKPHKEKPSSPKPVGGLRGEILKRGSRKPLVGARVRLVKHDRETMTDADGVSTLTIYPLRK